MKKKTAAKKKKKATKRNGTFLVQMSVPASVDVIVEAPSEAKARQKAVAELAKVKKEWRTEDGYQSLVDKQGVWIRDWGASQFKGDACKVESVDVLWTADGMS